MPYVTQKSRDSYRGEIKALVNKLALAGFVAGDLNFVFSEIVGQAFCHTPNYQTINNCVGALVGAKDEFNRRIVSRYEDLKIQENLDTESYIQASMVIATKADNLRRSQFEGKIEKLKNGKKTTKNKAC